MFFWRMVQQALRLHFRKRLLVAVTIFLGASLTTSMLAVMFDVGDKIKAELGSFGANLQVLPKGTSVVSEMYGTQSAHGALREEELPKLKTIFWAYNIEHFAPLLNVEADTGAGTVPVVGTWFDHHLDVPTGEEVNTGIQGMREWWQVDGSWVKGENEAIVGRRLAEQQGWALGDSVSLHTENANHSVRVVGILSSGSDEDRKLFTQLHTAQLLAERPGEVDLVEVRALTTPENELAQRAARDPSSLSLEEWETWYCTAYVSSIAYQIEEVLTDADAKAVRQVADNEGLILNKTQLLMTMVAVFAMVAAALGMANLVTASVMERSREIGLMKALGARNQAVVTLLLSETLIVGIVGGLFGFLTGVGLAQVIGVLVFGSAITLRPAVIPLMIVVTFATVLIGCLPAIRALLKLQPAQVLHGR